MNRFSTRTLALGGAAALALIATPTLARTLAQTDTAALEARIAQLEAQLTALKSEVQSTRTTQAAQTQALAQDIIRIDQRPAAPAPAACRPCGRRPDRRWSARNASDGR